MLDGYRRKGENWVTMNDDEVRSIITTLPFYLRNSVNSDNTGRQI